MLKLKEMMLCVMMLPLVVVGCTSKQSVDQCVKPPPASGVDNAASPQLADTAERDYFTPQREAQSLQKQLEGTRSILMSGADGVPISLGNSLIIVSNTCALPAEYKCLSNKPNAIIYECLLGFCLTTFSAPPQILAASTVSSAQFRNEEMI